MVTGVVPSVGVAGRWAGPDVGYRCSTQTKINPRFTLWFLLRVVGGGRRQRHGVSQEDMELAVDRRRG